MNKHIVKHIVEVEKERCAAGAALFFPDVMFRNVPLFIFEVGFV